MKWVRFVDRQPVSRDVCVRIPNTKVKYIYCNGTAFTGNLASIDPAIEWLDEAISSFHKENIRKNTEGSPDTQNLW